MTSSRLFAPVNVNVNAAPTTKKQTRKYPSLNNGHQETSATFSEKPPLPSPMQGIYAHPTYLFLDQSNKNGTMKLQVLLDLFCARGHK